MALRLSNTFPSTTLSAPISTIANNQYAHSYVGNPNSVGYSYAPSNSVAYTNAPISSYSVPSNSVSYASAPLTSSYTVPSNSVNYTSAPLANSYATQSVYHAPISTVSSTPSVSTGTHVLRSLPTETVQHTVPVSTTLTHDYAPSTYSTSYPTSHDLSYPLSFNTSYHQHQPTEYSNIYTPQAGLALGVERLGSLVGNSTQVSAPLTSSYVAPSVYHAPVSTISSTPYANSYAVPSQSVAYTSAPISNTYAVPTHTVAYTNAPLASTYATQSSAYHPDALVGGQVINTTSPVSSPALKRSLFYGGY